MIYTPKAVTESMANANAATKTMLIELTKKLAPEKKIQSTPFPVLSWHDAMNRYGSDKPDIRFEMELMDVSDLVKDCDFKVFSGAVQAGGVVKALRVEGAAFFIRQVKPDVGEITKDELRDPEPGATA